MKNENRQRLLYLLRAINKNYNHVLQQHQLDSQSIRTAYLKVLYEPCRLLNCVKVYQEIEVLLQTKSLGYYQYYLNSMCQAVKNKPKELLNHLCVLLSELAIESLYLKCFKNGKNKLTHKVS